MWSELPPLGVAVTASEESKECGAQTATSERIRKSFGTLGESLAQAENATCEFETFKTDLAGLKLKLAETTKTLEQKSLDQKKVIKKLTTELTGLNTKLAEHQL